MRGLRSVSEQNSTLQSGEEVDEDEKRGAVVTGNNDIYYFDSDTTADEDYTKTEQNYIYGEDAANNITTLKSQNELTSDKNNSIINKKLTDRCVNIHNETTNHIFDLAIVEEDLKRTDIGKEILEYIEYEGVFVTINYDFHCPKDTMGQTRGKDVEIFAQNCQNIQDVADTLIHEVCHGKYDWKYTQRDEVNCYLMEIKHRKGKIEKNDINRIIDFVKENYSDLPEGDLNGFGIH